MKSVQLPYSKFYDINAKYDYCGRSVGHSIENCRPFKYKVQQLIDTRWLTFVKVSIWPKFKRGGELNPF